MKVIWIILTFLIFGFLIPSTNSIDCSGATPYIDNFTSPGNPSCVASCSGEYPYIDENNKAAICVSSCIDSTPGSYIYPGNQSCLLNCGDAYPIRDKRSGLYPKCTNSCYPYYIDDLENPSICVEVCNQKNSNYYGLEYSIGANLERKCVTQCVAEKPVLDLTVASNPLCKAKCPLTAQYANKTTNNGLSIDVCIPLCEGKADQVDSESIKYCVDSCPDDRKYTDPKIGNGLCKSSCENIYAYLSLDSGYWCVDTCPANDAEFIDSNTTTQKTCVKECPIAFPYVVNETGLLKCVESCSDLSLYSNTIQYNSTLSIKKCVNGGGSGSGCNIIDDNSNCLSGCDKFVLEGGAMPICKDQCPENKPYVDRPSGQTYSAYCRAACDVEDRIYIDALSQPGTKYCVNSCKALSLYVNSSFCVMSCPILIDNTVNEPVCVDNCSGSYENKIGDPDVCVSSCEDYFYNELEEQHKCAENCPLNWEDSTKTITLDKKMCVASCNSQLYQYVRNGGQKCVVSCDDDQFYNELNEIHKCVEDCSGNWEDSTKTITAAKKMCVTSCALSLYQDNRNGQKCLTSCGEYYENDVASPKECSQKCEGSFQYETADKKKCTNTCNFENTELPFKQISENGDKKCVKTCNASYTPYLDKTTDSTNPECKSSCPESMKYLDKVTITDVSLCANSCSTIEGKQVFQYRDLQTNFISCVRPCPNDYPYADPVSNYSIGPVCTKRCPYSDFVVDNTTDSGMAICSKLCPASAPYIDHYARDDRALLCTPKCAANLFIDNLTFSGMPFCVKYCKNLIPMAFIDPTTAEFHKCTRQCPVEKPYVDWTDPDFPICSDACPNDHYIDSLTLPGTLFCVKSCKNLIPSSYIHTDGKQCVRKCNIINELDIENPKCTESCPAGAPYLNNLTNPGSAICVSSCKNLLPSAFINKDQNKCVSTCTDEENKFYIDYTNSDKPKCTDSCPPNAPYLNNLTNSGSPICVSSCNKLMPPAFINKDHNQCVRKCKTEESTFYINQIDLDNPMCTETCPPELPYIDQLTNPEMPICVASCKNLQTLSYIDHNNQKCVRACNDDAPYILTNVVDYNHYKCVQTCPPELPYIDQLTNPEMPICVASCKNLQTLSYIDHNNQKCVRTCNDDAPYILTNVVDYDHYKCVQTCPDTAPYIDSITNVSISVCVPSCKNLEPQAFIETGTNQCIHSCTEALPYVDNMTALHPKCVANCKDQQISKYIDNTTYHGSKVCVPVCQQIEPIAYIDPTNENFTICVHECPKELPYIDATIKEGDLTCVQKCSDVAPYIDSITNKSISVCVPSCKNILPQAFIENGTNKCIRSCTEDLPYIDNINSLYSKCISSCNETPNSKYIDNFTYFGSQVCTKSCKYLTPISYIDPRVEKHEICVHSCPQQLPYVDNITIQNDLLCVAKCPKTHPYHDSITTENVIYCVDSCWKIPAKAFIDALTDVNSPSCVVACKSTSPNLDRITNRGNPNCVIQCPKDTAMFLDNVSLPAVPVCLDKCEETAPYDDQVTIPTTPRCLKECLPGTYLYKNHCLACQSPCEQCFGTATNCTKCEQHYFLYNNSCPSICPDGYYGEIDTWTCDNCYDSCATCVEKSSTDCTSCNDNYIFTSKNECLSEDNFAGKTENLQIEEIQSMSELQFKTEQIKNIGNLNNTKQTQAEVQKYMKESMDKSIKYLDSYVNSLDQIKSSEESQIMANNLQKMTNITVELEVDQISTLVSNIVDKVDETKINQTIVNGIFETQDNLLKYKKNDYKKYNESASSISTAEDFLFEQIDKLSDKGLYVMLNTPNPTRRLLSDAEIQLFLEYQEFSLILESHKVDDNYWIQSVGTTQKETVNSYQPNEKLNYTDLAKVSVTYSKSFFTLLKSKISNLGKSVTDVALTKVIAYNYLRGASNKYERALLNSQTAAGSVVTFSFKCQDKSNATLFYNLDMTNLNDYIEVKVPINYKLTGEENLQCMTYNNDHDEWTTKNIITGEKTESYVICKTKQTNAITVLETEGIDFKKNYEIYLACLQLPLAAIIMFVAYFLKQKNQSIAQKYLSLSPWFSSLTCQNFYQLTAKLMLFSSQLGLIEFVIAGLFKYQNGLSEGDAKHITLVVFLALFIGYVGKYIFGAFLTAICIYVIPCVLYTILMVICYLFLVFWACYFVSHPNHDNAYNVGLESALIAIVLDFIIFDFFIIFIVKMIKLEQNQLKFFQFGGYLTLRVCKQNYQEFTKNISIESQNDQENNKIQCSPNGKQKETIDPEILKFEDDVPEYKYQQQEKNEDFNLTDQDEAKKSIKRLDYQPNQM